MRLFEFQAKKIFAEYGIPVPHSILVRSRDEIPDDFYPAVMKAQLLTGGRGKAGGIKLVNDRLTALDIFDQLINLKIKDEKTSMILWEEKVSIEKEFYLSLTIDRSERCPVFIASREGGIEIEETARLSPEKIIKIPLNNLLGLQEYQIRKASHFLGFKDPAEITSIMGAMFAIFKQEDASLIEINPLVFNGTSLIAVDAKMILDDNAEFRHLNRFSAFKGEQEDLLLQTTPEDEKMSREWGITYVKLDGNIGVISDGAGTGMLTLDMVNDRGGQAASFCELGGLGNAERMYKGIKMIHANPAVDVILISLIGGLTRMDEMAQGIVDFLDEKQALKPFFVRMCGTKEKEGIAILTAKQIPVFDDLETAVIQAVNFSKKAAK